MEKSKTSTSELLIKTTIIASFLVLIGWLLFIVFNTKALSESSLLIQYSIISIAFYTLFKLSSHDELLNS